MKVDEIWHSTTILIAKDRQCSRTITIEYIASNIRMEMQIFVCNGYHAQALTFNLKVCNSMTYQSCIALWAHIVALVIHKMA